MPKRRDRRGVHRGPPDALADPLERGWSGRVLDDGGLRFVRELRGVVETHDIDGALIRSSDARKLDDQAAVLQKRHAHPGKLRVKDREKMFPVPSPSWTPSRHGPQGCFHPAL